jgi:hypothetical protein
MTHSEILTMAMLDFAKVTGKKIKTTYLMAYFGNEQREIHFNPPLEILIDPNTDVQSLTHMNDEFLDPYYDITWHAPHPDLEGATSLYLDGISRNTLTGISETKHLIY